jgi:membrane associated rhomboid family serine protease
MFLHFGPLHLGLNMLALWWFGSAVETVLGRGRYLLLYIVSGLAGSAGALIANPNALTVGASGAIFGILGAAFVLERQRTYVLGGGAGALIVLNIIFSFTVSGISIGGHLGGLAGGAIGTLALSRFGRGHAIYGRPGLVGVVGLAAVGAISLAVAFWAANASV